MMLNMSRLLHCPDSFNDRPPHDSVIRLVNRHEFERRVKRVLLAFTQENEVHAGAEHAIFRIDLEPFETISETHGHFSDDELLRQFAQLLQGVVRVRDTLANLEVNGFGVLMEHCSLDHAYRAANKILQEVQGFQFSFNDHCFNINICIGIVPVTNQTCNYLELLKQVNATCNSAKGFRRNRIHLHSTNNENSSIYRGEPSWVADIYQAFEEDRFLIYIQPIVSLKEQDIPLIHYELLIRMCDKAGKIALPGTFLPALERFSMSSVLDQWVIHKAFRMIADEPEFLATIQFFSINLSGQSLVNHELRDYILSELEETGIPAEKVCFEITETSAISNLAVAFEFMLVLKEKGCRFALDDFGSGFSSLLYLKNLPVDYLKIDGSFIKNMTRESIDYAMVKSINEMSQAIGMETVAEFAENDEILQLLKDIGIDYAQGYSVGKPLSLTAFFSRMPQEALHKSMC